MINVIEDITKIVKDDNLHDVEISISSSNVIVNLSCKDYDGKIPIVFDSNEYNEYEIYIPKENLTSVIGIGDIDIIKDIMNYLSEYTSELNEICTEFDLYGRQELNANK